MPRETGYDFFQRYRDSEVSWSGRTLALPVNAGTSPPRVVLEEPDMFIFKSRWDKNTVKMKTIDGETKEIQLVPTPTIEELKKHAHNPRGLKLPTAKPMAFFQKNLPEVGQKNVWLKLGVTEWSTSYAHPIRILENDEQTVYFESPFGLQGYFCSCKFCKRCWSVQDGPHYLSTWEQYFVGSGGEHEMSYMVRQYQKQFLGHAGAIDRAVQLGLNDRMSGRAAIRWSYLNSWSDDRPGARGSLMRFSTPDVIYNVPDFVELEPVNATEPVVRVVEVNRAAAATPSGFDCWDTVEWQRSP